MVHFHWLTGINAYIGLDLGIATAIVSAGAGIENIHSDFNKINTILCDLITEVKTCLYGMWPLSKLISKLTMGKLENDIAGFSMNVARDAAWQVAVDYAALDTEEKTQQYLTERDNSIAEFSKKILNPGPMIKTVSGIFRMFEFGSIAKKIQRLDT